MNSWYLKRVSGSIYKSLINLKEIIGLFVFWAAFIAEPFSPDLDVTYKIDDFYISSNIAEVPERSGIAEKSDIKILTIILKSNARDEINDVELIINGIEEILSTGVRSSSNRILENSLQKEDDIVFVTKDRAFLKAIKSVPPGHNIQIQILGRFFDLLLKNRIEVVTTHDVHVSETSELSGIIVMIYEHFMLITASIVIVLIYVGFRRFDKEEVS